jgi:hypothetical protein
MIVTRVFTLRAPSATALAERMNEAQATRNVFASHTHFAEGSWVAFVFERVLKEETL